MSRLVILLFMVIISLSSVITKTLDSQVMEETSKTSGHTLWKRFINPSLTFGGFADAGVTKMRTKRNAEECEKLELCRLHARSGHNLFAAFQLYFVNRENAQLWDHRARSAAECRKRYSGCEDYD